MDTNPYDDLALQINRVALAAVDAVAIQNRDVAEEVERRLADSAPKTIPRRLLIDLSDKKSDTNEDVLSIRLLRLNRWVGAEARDHNGATSEDVEKCRRFPQRKYVDKHEEWLVPLTTPNVEHLLNSWRPEQYELLIGAKLMLDVYFNQQKAQGKHLSERAEFLATGVAPQLDDYVYADNGMPPMAHQKVGFSSTRHAEFFSLIMDPGTGKTRIMIDTICDRSRKQRAQWAEANGLTVEQLTEELVDEDGKRIYPPQLRVLVLAPRNVLRTWQQQLAEWSTVDVNCETLRGSKLTRAGLLATLLSDKATPILVGIINYEGVEIIEEFLIPPDGRQVWDVIVADES